MAPDLDAVSMCQKLATDHGRRLVENLTSSKESNAMMCSPAPMASKGAIRLKARKSSEDPKCSPVCAMELDAVLVLSPSGGSITAASVERSKSHVEMLLEHFELGNSGSLFGLVDISRGVDNPKVVTKLSGDRNSLNSAMEAWAPQLGGPAVTEAELQGIESKPAMLDMIKDSRKDTKRALVILDVAPPKPGNNGTENAAEVPILVSVNGGKFERVPMPDKGHIDDLKYEVVETLVAVCPAIVIDPTMACGRLRWGKGESADPQAEGL